MDVDHPEFVGVAAGRPGGMLACREIPVLFGFELDLAGFLLEDVERLFLSDLKQLGCRSGSSALGPGDLGRLFQRETEPCCRATLSSAESPSTFPVATVSLACPIDVPVTRASENASSSFPARAATPKSTNRRARA
ncbi:MAG: hypothetical protein ABI571_07070 [Actinomycetota bacterium]